jgi:hypothetical protein
VTDDLAELARLITELNRVAARLYTTHLAPRHCDDCGRPEQSWQPVHDPAGRITGWRGPTCARRRGTGDQLPLDSEDTEVTS